MTLQGAFHCNLQSATDSLCTDFISGARQHLSHLTPLAAAIANTRSELWALLIYTAQQLSHARPSMSAAISSCLLRALAHLEKVWNAEVEVKQGRENVVELARIAGEVFEQILRERSDVATQLAQHFTCWLQNYCAQQPAEQANQIHILTLSYSSTLLTALLHALSDIPPIHLTLTLLESRPRCEAADFALQLYNTNSHPSRLCLRIVPDCAVGSVAEDVDIVLLGADKVSPEGDVKNKIGSLAAVVCAKHLATYSGKNIAVVVVSDTDKIAATTCDTEEKQEIHPAKELTATWSNETREGLEGKDEIKILGEWFEWVPARYVDVYVTEIGVLSGEEVAGKAREVEELERRIFGRKD